MIEKSIITENFSAIENDIPATIIINQAETFSITANGQANILDLIEFKVNANKLNIDFKQMCVNSNFDSLSISITLPNLKSIEINGSGQAIIENNLQCDNLNINISGSGNIKASIEASKNVKGSISGSGSIELSGNAAEASYDISGSGEIHAFDFQTLKSSINISGSGDAELMANESLNADISGSGDVQYKGSPKITSSVSGSGEVRAAN
jgi:hypothetical protein